MVAARIFRGRVGVDFSGKIPPGLKARIRMSRDAKKMYLRKLTSKNVGRNC